MARKITMFELHFDGAHIGPTFGDTSGDEGRDDVTDVADDAAEYGSETVTVEGETAMDAPSGTGGSRLPRLAVVAAVAVGVVAGRRALRRFRSDDTEQVTLDEVEGDDEAAEVTVE